MKKNPHRQSPDFSLPVILALTLIAYLPVFKSQFVNWDDDIYILNNIHLRSVSVENLKFLITQYFYGNFHPFTMLLLFLEYRVDGANPLVFHLTGILFHLANVVLVFKLARELFHNREIAWVTSLLFGIHPLQVESVGWSAEMKNLLYTFFFLLSMIQYVKYVQKTHPLPLNPIEGTFTHPHLGAGGQGGKKFHTNKFFIFSFFFFICSLLSKGQAVTLALTLLLIDFLLDRKWYSKKCLYEKIPFFIVAVLFGIIAILAQQSSHAIQIGTTLEPYQRVLVACYGYAMYLVKLAVPIGLSAIYPYPDTISWIFWLMPAIPLFFLFFTMKYFTKHPIMIFGLFFYTVNVGPVLQLIPVGNAILADRYAYLPSIGIFLIAGLFYSRIIHRKQILLPGGKTIELSQWKKWIQRCGGGYVFVLLILTFNRASLWGDSMKLWNDVLEKYPSVPEAINNRGTIKRTNGDINGAMSDYEKAIDIRPGFDMAWYNKGLVKYYSKNYVAAIVDFSEAIANNPNYLDAYSNRGLCYALLEKFDSAMSDFNRTVELNQQDPYSYFNRGFGYYQWAQKINRNQNVEKTSPAQLADTVRSLLENAVREFGKATDIDPGMGNAFLYRGLCRLMMGEKETGCEDFLTASRLGVKEGYSQYQALCR